MNSQKTNCKVGIQLLAVLALNSIAISQSLAASWTTNTPMNSPRYHHTATLLPDGRVLVTGGAIADQYTFTNGAEIYDPAAGMWTSTPPMHMRRKDHTATLLNDGTVLVVGGGNNPLIGDNEPEIYDPSTGLWSTNHTMTCSRQQHTATLLPNGQVLVAGGWGNYPSNANYSYIGVQAIAELYDPISGKWANAGFMNTSRYHHTATLLPNGKVLVAGGFTANSSTGLTSAELFDPATKTWTYTGSMIEPHAFQATTLLPNGKVLEEPSLDSNNFYTTNVEIYDPTTGSWAYAPPMIVTHSLHTATLLPNGKMLTAGGAGNTTELYNPAGQVWSISGTMSNSRFFATATLLQNGNVLVAGGISGSALASTEIFSSSNITISAFDSLSAMKPSANAFQVSFTNTPDVSFFVCSTTNLILPLNAWTIVGGAVEIAPGQYQFTDCHATNTGQRFYRVLSP